MKLLCKGDLINLINEQNLSIKKKDKEKLVECIFKSINETNVYISELYKQKKVK